ncbi:hypothetical protein TSOC_002380 [Tetrabaena socialis]|uniref:Uncharacterized protein n=1 Tax=Tetrabaena socialis TaxID=47790 RepID=A0A2J8AEE4_9CHLO|nr:hypothetical protein TSOC_002380 [Tetrabaena socialis]|eukprot:PNH10895.1 hypothetical protein TSOC_002380 [Tetrabaena socialis]
MRGLAIRDAQQPDPAACVAAQAAGTCGISCDEETFSACTPPGHHHPPSPPRRASPASALLQPVPLQQPQQQRLSAAYSLPAGAGVADKRRSSAGGARPGGGGAVHTPVGAQAASVLRGVPALEPPPGLPSGASVGPHHISECHPSLDGARLHHLMHNGRALPHSGGGTAPALAGAGAFAVAAAVRGGGRPRGPPGGGPGGDGSGGAPVVPGAGHAQPLLLTQPQPERRPVWERGLEEAAWWQLQQQHPKAPTQQQQQAELIPLQAARPSGGGGSVGSRTPLPQPAAAAPSAGAVRSKGGATVLSPEHFIHLPRLFFQDHFDTAAVLGRGLRVQVQAGSLLDCRVATVSVASYQNHTGYRYYRLLGFKDVPRRYTGWRVAAWDKVADDMVRVRLSPPLGTSLAAALGSVGATPGGGGAFLAPLPPLLSPPLLAAAYADSADGGEDAGGNGAPQTASRHTVAPPPSRRRVAHRAAPPAAAAASEEEEQGAGGGAAGLSRGAHKEAAEGAEEAEEADCAAGLAMMGLRLGRGAPRRGGCGGGSDEEGEEAARQGGSEEGGGAGEWEHEQEEEEGDEDGVPCAHARSGARARPPAPGVSGGRGDAAAPRGRGGAAAELPAPPRARPSTSAAAARAHPSASAAAAAAAAPGSSEVRRIMEEGVAAAVAWLGVPPSRVRSVVSQNQSVVRPDKGRVYLQKPFVEAGLAVTATPLAVQVLINAGGVLDPVLYPTKVTLSSSGAHGKAEYLLRLTAPMKAPHSGRLIVGWSSLGRQQLLMHLADQEGGVLSPKVPIIMPRQFAERVMDPATMLKHGITVFVRRIGDPPQPPSPASPAEPRGPGAAEEPGPRGPEEGGGGEGGDLALAAHVEQFFHAQGYSQYRVLGLKEVSCGYQNWRIEMWEALGDRTVRLTISAPAHASKSAAPPQLLLLPAPAAQAPSPPPATAHAHTHSPGGSAAAALQRLALAPGLAVAAAAAAAQPLLAVSTPLAAAQKRSPLAAAGAGSGVAAGSGAGPAGGARGRGRAIELLVGAGLVKREAGLECTEDELLAGDECEAGDAVQAAASSDLGRGVQLLAAVAAAAAAGGPRGEGQRGGGSRALGSEAAAAMAAAEVLLGGGGFGRAPHPVVGGGGGFARLYDGHLYDGAGAQLARGGRTTAPAAGVKREHGEAAVGSDDGGAAGEEAAEEEGQGWHAARGAGGGKLLRAGGGGARPRLSGEGAAASGGWKAARPAPEAPDAPAPAAKPHPARRAHGAANGSGGTTAGGAGGGGTRASGGGGGRAPSVWREGGGYSSLPPEDMPPELPGALATSPHPCRKSAEGRRRTQGGEVFGIMA